MLLFAGGSFAWLCWCCATTKLFGAGRRRIHHSTACRHSSHSVSSLVLVLVLV